MRYDDILMRLLGDALSLAITLLLGSLGSWVAICDAHRQRRGRERAAKEQLRIAAYEAEYARTHCRTEYR